MAGFGIELVGEEIALKALDRYAPASLAKAMERALRAAGRAARPFIRREAPKGKTGNLRKSVSVRRVRRGRGEVSEGSVVVGPVGGRGRGAHRHLVIRGHRIVTVSGHDTGRRSRSNAFVDRGVNRAGSRVEEAFKRELRKS